VTVCAWAGDGGTFDIGIQALSAAAERNENIIYVCYDNEAYMNTGVQRSSATPLGAWTTTTPAARPKRQGKKDLVGILAAHGVPYVATATIAYPEDLIAKLQRAKAITGLRFLHILAPCPAGWKIPSEQVVRYSRLAVASRVFPLFEVASYRWPTTSRARAASDTSNGTTTGSPPCRTTSIGGGSGSRRGCVRQKPGRDSTFGSREAARDDRPARRDSASGGRIARSPAAWQAMTPIGKAADRAAGSSPRPTSRTGGSTLAPDRVPK
jgi:hypothetical protein